MACNAAGRLKLLELIEELLNLNRDALTHGVNDEHLGRALSILNYLTALAGGPDKILVRGRGRPRKPVKSKPAKKPGERDRRILVELERNSLRLKLDASVRGQELDRRRIYRSARKAAIDGAAKRNDLNANADRRTDRARIDKLWRRELENRRQQLIDAMLGGPRAQNGSKIGEK